MGCFSLDHSLSSAWARSVNLDVSCTQGRAAPSLSSLYHPPSNVSNSSPREEGWVGNEQPVVEELLRDLGYENIALERIFADMKSLGVNYFFDRLQKVDTSLPKQAAFARFTTMLSAAMQMPSQEGDEWLTHDAQVLHLVRQLKIGVLAPTLLPSPELLDKARKAAQAGHFCILLKDVADLELKSDRSFLKQLLLLLRSAVAAMMQHRMTPAAVLSELALVLEAAVDEALPAAEAQKTALMQANHVRKSLYEASLASPLDAHTSPMDYDKAMERFTQLSPKTSDTCISAAAPPVAKKLASSSSAPELKSSATPLQPKKGAVILGALGPAWRGIGYKVVAKVQNKYYSLSSGLKVEYEIGNTYEDEALPDSDTGLYFCRTPFEARQAHQRNRAAAGLQNAPQVVLQCRCEGPFAIRGVRQFACSLLTPLREEHAMRPRESSPARIFQGEPTHRKGRNARRPDAPRPLPVSRHVDPVPVSRPQSAPITRPPPAVARPKSAPYIRGVLCAEFAYDPFSFGETPVAQETTKTVDPWLQCRSLDLQNRNKTAQQTTKS